MRFLLLICALICMQAGAYGAQAGASAQAWRDPSPHRVQLVPVDKDVQLEVLDWGGTGRALVLLAGGGNTAHVFDDFAPKLTGECHVYGITRRGFGASSAPAPQNGNYAADRLGSDVIAVLDALKLDRPVVAGHSIAGEELSWIGERHPERVSGLIYLDAGYSYAYYSKSGGDLGIDLEELKTKLDQFRVGMGSDETQKRVHELLDEQLPGFERDLRGLQENLNVLRPLPDRPTPADLSSFAAYRSMELRLFGWAAPEGEVRQQFETTPEGGMGKRRDQQAASVAIIAGEQKFGEIHVPILAIFAVPHYLGPYADKDPAARDAWEARDAVNGEASAKDFENGEPSARVVRLQRASHYVFINKEAEVLREMRTFLANLN